MGCAGYYKRCKYRRSGRLGQFGIRVKCLPFCRDPDVGNCNLVWEIFADLIEPRLGPAPREAVGSLLAATCLSSGPLPTSTSVLSVDCKIGMNCANTSEFEYV